MISVSDANPVRSNQIGRGVVTSPLRIELVLIDTFFSGFVNGYVFVVVPIQRLTARAAICLKIKLDGRPASRTEVCSGLTKLAVIVSIPLPDRHFVAIANGAEQDSVQLFREFLLPARGLRFG